MRIGWTTDIHLNFLRAHEFEAFLDGLNAANLDRLLIGGDIGEAPSVSIYLEMIATSFQKPIYFVLGNHDFYRGSIQAVRQEIRGLCQQSSYLRWLSAENVIELNSETALVGHDGWGDGRLGNVKNMISLNDDVYIQEMTHGGLIARLNALGDEAADHIRQLLPVALEKYPLVYVLTHVPPFKESCWHNGSASGDEWLPRFPCHAMGAVLWEMAQKYPQRKLTVLCGHTHGSGEVKLRDNLHVITGGAEYGNPQLNRVFELA